jgi:hypothetical protein
MISGSRKRAFRKVNDVSCVDIPFAHLNFPNTYTYLQARSSKNKRKKSD